MEKIRVYQLARDLDTNSKRLMEKLAEVGVIVKNHMSLLEDDELDTLYRHIGIKTKAQDTERAVLGASTPAQQTVGSKQPDAAFGDKTESKGASTEGFGTRETAAGRVGERDGVSAKDRGAERDEGGARAGKSVKESTSSKVSDGSHEAGAKKSVNGGDTRGRKDSHGSARDVRHGGVGSVGSGGDARSQQSAASARTQKDVRNAPRIIRTTEINLDKSSRDDRRDFYRQGGSPQQQGQGRRGGVGSGGIGSGGIGVGGGGSGNTGIGGTGSGGTAHERQFSSRRDGGRGRDRDRRRREQGYDRGDHFRATESNSGLIAGFTRMTREESMKQLLAEARAQQKKLAQLAADGLLPEQSALTSASKLPGGGLRDAEKAAAGSGAVAAAAQAETAGAAVGAEKAVAQETAVTAVTPTGYGAVTYTPAQVSDVSTDARGTQDQRVSTQTLDAAHSAGAAGEGTGATVGAGASAGAGQTAGGSQPQVLTQAQGDTKVPEQASETTRPDASRAVAASASAAAHSSETRTQAAAAPAQTDTQTQAQQPIQAEQQPRTTPVIYRADGTRLETVKTDSSRTDGGRRGDTSKTGAFTSDGARTDGRRGGEQRGDYTRSRQGGGYGSSADGRNQQQRAAHDGKGVGSTSGGSVGGGSAGGGQQRASYDGRSRPKASFDGRSYQQRQTQQGQDQGHGYRDGQGQGARDGQGQGQWQGHRDGQGQGQGQRGFYRDRDRGDRGLGQATGYTRGGGVGYRGGSASGGSASGGQTGTGGTGYGYRQGQGQGQGNRPFTPRDGRQQYGQGGGSASGGSAGGGTAGGGHRYGSGGGYGGGSGYRGGSAGGSSAGGGSAGGGMSRQRTSDFQRPETLGKPTETGAAKNEQKREFLRKDSAKEVKKDLKREGAKPAPTTVSDRNRRFRPQVSIIGEKKGVHEFSNDDFIIREFYESSDGQKRVRRQQRGRKGLAKEKYIPPRAILTSVIIPENLTVKELAEILKKTAGDVIKKLIGMGMVATINESLDYDVAALIAGEFGIEAEKEVVVSEEDILFDDADAEENDLEPRAPVVVVMGHVDHGKTSLLDAIRNTNVISSEAGGITQHIGAYKVTINGHAITFLDTPGHEAFTSMRARGAMVTDIAILVVSAVDGVMPQTIEAINHARAAKVSIIIAINMMDREGANPERVKQELTEYGIVVEEWGGDIIAVPVSAKTGENIGQLLEMVLLTADMLELRASPSQQAKGTVIEAKLDKNRGPVATLLVQRGTLRVGDSFITGTTVGRIRAMLDDRGGSIREAGPSTPVEIIGLSEVPGAGEVFYVTTDDKVTKSLAEKRRLMQREEQLRSSSRVTLDDLFSQIQEGKVKDLNIIIKADVQGSAEAVRNSLEKLGNDDVRINIIHTGVGAINESDVSLASVSNAIIIGFNVRPGGASVIEAAETAGVDLRLYTVIYNAIEDIQAAMKGMLDPTFREVVLGHVEIRQIFKASGVGTIGGCYVLDGKIQRSNSIRVIRDGVTVFDGKLASLRRFKDDAREVLQGFECGISVERFNDLKENDIIEPYTMEEVPAG